MTASTATDVTTEIRRLNALLASHLEQGDASAMASLYTSNAVLMPTGTEPIQGQAGIAAFWQSALAMGLKQLELHTIEVEELASTAIEMGRYTLFGREHQAVDNGKYMVVWKQEQGQWKLHQDIWNSSVAAPAPQEAA